ncbi:MAG: hypothetical protein ABI659_04310 [Nitrosospira sp.]
MPKDNANASAVKKPIASQRKYSGLCGRIATFGAKMPDFLLGDLIMAVSLRCYDSGTLRYGKY